MYEFLRYHAGQISEDALRDAWATMEAQGTLKLAFHGWRKSERTVENFIACASSPHNDYYLIRRAGETDPLAFSWLTWTEPRRAFIHHCGFLHQPTHRRVHGGVAFCSWLLNSKREDGEYFFDVLLGLTPEPFHTAWKYASALGFILCGVIPHACYMADTNETVPGFLSCLTRESLNRRKEASRGR